MKWFRRKIRTGSRLALFALALQFGLSFGHFHFHAAQAAPSFPALAGVAQALDTGADAASERQEPASHDDQRSNEPCAVCAVVSMANQIAFAAPAALPLPDAIDLPVPRTETDLARPGAAWVSFRSRAPPVS